MAAVFIILFNGLSFSQLSEILVLNEGAYDYVSNQQIEPVSVGKYDLAKGLYTKQFEIPGARFASDIVLDGDSYWVAADRYVVQYDLTTHQPLQQLVVTGVRKLAFHKDYLILTRGEYLQSLGAYIQIYNKHSLQLIREIPASTLPYTTEQLQIKQDKAYIAVNNGFDFGKEVGQIAILDLATLELEQVLDLGPAGKNPENLMLKDQTIITLNNKDFTGSSVSILDLETQSLNTYELQQVSSLCGTSTLVGSSVLYQEIGKTELGVFDLTSRSSGFFKDAGTAFYGMTFDPVSAYIVSGETNFKDFGRVHVYDQSFNEKWVFESGVTPGYFAFVQSKTVGQEEWAAENLRIYPNPASGMLNISVGDGLQSVQLMDAFGRVLVERGSESIDVSKLAAGSYFIRILKNDRNYVKSFVKSQD
ncbi:MAG TPA: T9SS type A sorting domain-containing protein [Saprospiraceae bacterium]|nr:T9SS type A sorting domain-containing protein [Saprospiraceae bacterium]